MTIPQLSEQTAAQPAPARLASLRHAEQITEIAGRLRRRYPSAQISSTDLEERVRDVHRQFDTVRVRTFVAVFVERLVRGSIEQPPPLAGRRGAARSLRARAAEDSAMRTPATAAAQLASRPHGADTIVALSERIKRAGRRRAGRFRLALLVVVLLLPLLLTSLLGGR